MKLVRPNCFAFPFDFDLGFRRQFLATLLVDLSAFIFGLVIGFTGPNLELFKSEQTPLDHQITINEESWISSLAAFGAISSALIFGFISERFGRKVALIIIGIPQTLSWIFMAFATNVEYIYISRVLSGIAGAGCFFVVPVYVAEFSDKNIRGSLCASFSVVCNTGIFIEFVLAEYVDFRLAAAFATVVSMIFVIGTIFLPESPQYLVSKNRFEEAEKALKFFRGLGSSDQLTADLASEFNTMKEISVPTDGSQTKFEDYVKHVLKPGVLKNILLAFVISQFPILSGCFVLITYNQGIFKSANITVLSVFWSSLVFAFIQIVASIFTMKLVDRVGRKKILIWSSFSSGVCLALFGIYMFLKTETDVFSNMSSGIIGFIALLTVFLEVLMSSVGIIPVPNFIPAEILDQKIRSTAVSLFSWWNWIMGFLIIKFFPTVESSFGLHSVMIFFAITCCFCGFFTITALPETKGRDIEEIARDISSDKRQVEC